MSRPNRNGRRSKKTLLARSKGRKLKTKKAAPQAAQAKRTAQRIAKAVSDKGAERVSVLDVRGVVGYTDYVVVCSVQSDRAARAVADHVLETMAAAGHRAFVTEGYDTASWILLDFSDVITHVFLPEARDFYDLDGLWIDAPKVTGWEVRSEK
ncbi:MAG: ribosome silencing factor [Deltaproteobacteria bacterium]|nr:ribosome silencing factor [Deltaproteobacteria bacterium]